MFCGKRHPCPTLLNPQPTAGQQTITTLLRKGFPVSSAVAGLTCHLSYQPVWSSDISLPASSCPPETFA